jgi:hypothetical protein
LHYEELRLLGNRPLPLPNERAMGFITTKPLERDCDYILAFAANANNRFATLYVRFPDAKLNEYAEIKLDNKLRLIMLPFKVKENNTENLFLINTLGSSSIWQPIILRSPYKNSTVGNIKEGAIFQVVIGDYKFSYNPWLKGRIDLLKEGCPGEFLERSLSKNPILYFMKLFRISIPLDLYRYSWSDKSRGSSEIIAVRY